MAVIPTGLEPHRAVTSRPDSDISNRAASRFVALSGVALSCDGLSYAVFSKTAPGAVPKRVVSAPVTWERGLRSDCVQTGRRGEQSR